MGGSGGGTVRYTMGAGMLPCHLELATPRSPASSTPTMTGLPLLTCSPCSPHSPVLCLLPASGTRPLLLSYRAGLSSGCSEDCFSRPGKELSGRVCSGAEYSFVLRIGNSSLAAKLKLFLPVNTFIFYTLAFSTAWQSLCLLDLVYF